MKKKLSVLLVLVVLLVSVFPVNILGAGVTCSGGCDHVAAIGNTHYASVQEALDAAEDGQTVKVIKSHDLDVSVVQDIPELDGYVTVVYYKYNHEGQVKPFTELQGVPWT